jgi:pantoate--beta-alanine ligase
MKVFKTIKETSDYCNYLKTRGCQTGLVPTMGALHKGHLSLVEKASIENEVTAVSIFVNPIQFNDHGDLIKYPRDLGKDLDILCPYMDDEDFVFCPDVDEMYPEPVKKKYDFGRIAEVMEGSFRPGHFNGVGVVVEKLFRIITPERAYFGEKDFQQLAIIRKMTSLEKLDIDIIGCPIVRESDGLAMSSRNQLLDAEARRRAGIIYKTISSAKKLSLGNTVAKTKELIIDMINSYSGFEVEYVEFADEKSLEPLDSWNDSRKIRCFIAVRAGNVRLIDNLGLDN